MTRQRFFVHRESSTYFVFTFEITNLETLEKVWLEECLELLALALTMFDDTPTRRPFPGSFNWLDVVLAEVFSVTEDLSTCLFSSECEKESVRFINVLYSDSG